MSSSILNACVYLNHRSVHPFIFYSIADDVNVGDQTNLIKKEEISQSRGATETISVTKWIKSYLLSCSARLKCQF